MTRYGLHPEALLDLEEIHDYIAKDSPTAARRVIEEIFAKIERAVDFPEMGHFNHDLTSRSIRFLHVSDYLIAYVEHQRSLWVISVVHGKRNPRVLAAIFRARQ